MSEAMDVRKVSRLRHGRTGGHRKQIHEPLPESEIPRFDPEQWRFLRLTGYHGPQRSPHGADGRKADRAC